MDSKTYVNWLKGLAMTIHGQPTQEQWEMIKSVLRSVYDNPGLNKEGQQPIRELLKG